MTKEYAGYLAHYGIKGQKWGVRNWQNEDGTYTDAGKQHYGWGNGYHAVAGVGGSPPANLSLKSRIKAQARYADRQDAVRSQQEERSAQAEEARRSRTRKLLAISSGVAIASIAAYRGSPTARARIRKSIGNWMKTTAVGIAGLGVVGGAVYASEAIRKNRERAVKIRGYMNSGYSRAAAEKMAQEKYDSRMAYNDWVKMRRRG